MKNTAMKKLNNRITVSAITLAVAASALCVPAFAQASSALPVEPEEALTAVQESNSAESASLTKAFDAALAHAGVSESNVTDIEIDQKQTPKGIYYEIEFETRDTKYEYSVTPGGEIALVEAKELPQLVRMLRKEISNDDLIGISEALSIALENAGCSENDVRKIGIDLNTLLTGHRYEVEFKTSLAEYEYRLDAATGSIVRRDIDKD